jgi:hypothetical protein
MEIAASGELSLTATQYIDLPAVELLEADAFGADEGRLQSLRDWYTANPNGFSVLRDNRRGVVGCVNYLALRPEAAGRLLAGCIGERDINTEDLFSPTERDCVRDVYGESIILSKTGSFRDQHALCLILAHLDRLLERIVDLTIVRSSYGLAVNRVGERFMRKLGYELVCPGAERCDGRDLFVAPISRILDRASSLAGPRS